MKRIFLVAVLLALASMPAFSQSNATLSGTVTDATQAVLPGVSVKALNTETGIAKTTVSNAAGVYSFAGMQVGMYDVTAELSGFQTQTFRNVKLGNNAQVRLNFSLEIKKLEQSVEVSIQADNLILDTSASSGSKLDEKKVSELPIVNSNVLSLVKVMGGVTVTESPIFGADDTQFAGISASNINLTRDGVTANDVRYSTGLNSPVYLNPEIVGEFKMVLAPVDAEMGRGNGQVQVVTRSGGNAYHGSLVWNNQNTALDANEWYDNLQGTPRDWRNQNEYTASIGGPIIKNKTFFFASWNQQFSRIRQNNINMQVPTPCARKTIFRYFDGWSNGNTMAVQYIPTAPSDFSVPVTKVVDANGNPLPLTMPYDSTQKSTLHYMSVFGPLLKTPQTNDCSDVTLDPNTGFPTSDWVDYAHPYDPLRTPDSSGYIKKFMSLIPSVNNYQAGDGLNWGGYRWVRHLNGGDNIYGLGEGPNRKQITVRLDHNFSPMHRISGTYSFEKDKGEDSFATMEQNSWGGAVLRSPQNFSINLVSTLRPTLLNEARVGLTRTKSHTYDPYFNPDNGDKVKNALTSLYPNSPVPVVIGLGNPGFQIGNGAPGVPNPFGNGRGNMAASWGGHDPRWVYADTLTWTKGRHSMRFGAEAQRTQSYQEITGALSFMGVGASSMPAASGGGASWDGIGANSGLHLFWGPNLAAMPGAVGGQFAGNVVSGAYNLLNIYAGSIDTVAQYRFINSPSATTYNDISKGETTRVTDYRANQLSFFMQDDWRITDSLTLNLGMRYDWYGVPYLKGGMTAGIKGGALNVFGRSGNSFDDWMKPGTVSTDGSISYKGKDAELAFIGPDSPNPDQKIYNNDMNNFGPVFGFAWQLPWFGKGKTVIRGGYQMSYMPQGRADATAFLMPKIEYQVNYKRNSEGLSYINLSNLPQLLPVVPMPGYIKPVAADSIPPVQQRSQSVTVFDPDLRTPYVQNLNMSITRNITSNVILDVRYIGTLSRKQQGSINLNAPNIWNNGLKQAFDDARAGRESDLLNRMFNGINIAGNANPWINAYGPVGSDFNGVPQTGAMHLRAAPSTSALLANGDYIGLANTLATMNYDTSLPGNQFLPALGTDVRGTVLRLNKFPENFIYTSPQFSTATWTGNFNHSNYHSLQAQLTLRPIHGFNFQGTYTWAKNLGMQAYTDVRDRAYDYGLNSQNRAHQLAINGAFELPFGPGRWLLNGNHGVISRIAGGWQMSWIANINAGRPFSITAQSMLYGNGVPNQVGMFDTKSGENTWPEGSRTGSYWYDPALAAKQMNDPTIPADQKGTKYAHVQDPQCLNVTEAQGLRGNCSLQAIALREDTSKLIFVNPYPTERGNFRANSVTMGGVWSADMAMSKTIRVTEGKNLRFRVDATNIFNHAMPTAGSWQSGVVRTRVPGAPVASLQGQLDWTTWQTIYRPLGYMDAKVGARTFQAQVRMDF